MKLDSLKSQQTEVENERGSLEFHKEICGDLG